jgi:AcrR family transcriptional regulator
VKSTRRSYESPTRKEHAELTRTKIVEALMDLLIEERPVSISIPAVAARADVSVRTVYHHFPSKEALFDALPEASRRQGTVEMADVSSPAEMAGVARDVFAYFEGSEPLFNAMRMSEASARVRSALDRRAVERTARALAPWAPRLDPASLERLQGVVGSLLSYDMYRSLTGRYGLDRDDAADAVAWAITSLADRARRTGKVGHNNG